MRNLLLYTISSFALISFVSSCSDKEELDMAGQLQYLSENYNDLQGGANIPDLPGALVDLNQNLGGYEFTPIWGKVRSVEVSQYYKPWNDTSNNPYAMKLYSSMIMEYDEEGYMNKYSYHAKSYFEHQSDDLFRIYERIISRDSKNRISELNYGFFLSLSDSGNISDKLQPYQFIYNEEKGVALVRRPSYSENEPERIVAYNLLPNGRMNIHGKISRYPNPEYVETKEKSANLKSISTTTRHKEKYDKFGNWTISYTKEKHSDGTIKIDNYTTRKFTYY